MLLFCYVLSHMFGKWGSMDERTREYKAPAKLLPAGHLHTKAAFLEQRISTNNPINIDSLPFLKCLLLVVHFPVRSTHPFFRGHLAPEDLVLCSSRERRASTLTERGGGVSFDIVTIFSIFIMLFESVHRWTRHGKQHPWSEALHTWTQASGDQIQGVQPVPQQQ